MENKTDFLKEGRIGNLKNDSLSLIQARQNALHQTATALEYVISLQQLSEELNSQNQGNIRDAKMCLVDSMVYLAIASSDGDYKKSKELLAEYGLEDMI